MNNESVSLYDFLAFGEPPLLERICALQPIAVAPLSDSLLSEYALEMVRGQVSSGNRLPLCCVYDQPITTTPRLEIGAVYGDGWESVYFEPLPWNMAESLVDGVAFFWDRRLTSEEVLNLLMRWSYRGTRVGNYPRIPPKVAMES